MFGIGAQEMAIIGLLALLVFGPGKLPEMARDLGGFFRKIRDSADEFKSEFAFEETREQPLRGKRKQDFRALEVDHSLKEDREDEGLKKGHDENQETAVDGQPKYGASELAEASVDGTSEEAAPAPVPEEGGERKG